MIQALEIQESVGKTSLEEQEKGLPSEKVRAFETSHPQMSPYFQDREALFRQKAAVHKRVMAKLSACLG